MFVNCLVLVAKLKHENQLLTLFQAGMTIAKSPVGGIGRHWGLENLSALLETVDVESVKFGEPLPCNAGWQYRAKLVVSTAKKCRDLTAET